MYDSNVRGGTRELHRTHLGFRNHAGVVVVAHDDWPNASFAVARWKKKSGCTSSRDADASEKGRKVWRTVTRTCVRA